MPFQTAIERTAWPLYCISYNELKRSVYDILKVGSTAVFPEKEFQELLQAELDKINLFAVIKYEDIFRSLQSIANNVEPPSTISSDPIRVREYHLDLEVSIDSVAREIVNLDKYVRVNCEGFIRIISKFDKICQTHGTNWFVARLGKEQFCNINFQSLFILLSLTWSKFRSVGKDTSSKDTKWRPPESFVRSTAKYWVKPENVASLKASVLKHLPYLIFGSSVKDQEQFLDPTALPEDTTNMSETQLVTSIYFDNTNRDIYRDRILRKEGARLVRFRWYGPNEGSPDQEVFIERKVHHESWYDEASSKDRFVIKQSQVVDFMRGKFPIDEQNFEKKSKNLAHEVNSLIQKLSLQPFIRTCYYRCAFQLASSNDVRVSLDTQMSLINELRDSRDSWCRLASDVLAEEDIFRFPYAILEIKLGDARNSPVWVDAMLQQCGAIRVHKFSKFIHAMAFLHPSELSLLPHWFSDFQKKSAPPSPSGDGQTWMENVLISNDDESDQQPATTTTKLKDMKAIEPKSIFANERTFLHYCQKGLYLLTVAIVALNSGAAICAAICMVYFVTVYRQFVSRQAKLLNRHAVGGTVDKLNVQSGPMLAAAMILLGSLISASYTSGQ